MPNRARIIRLLAALVSVCFVGTAVFIIGSRIIVGTLLKEPTTIDVVVEAPEQVRLNEPFAVTLQFTNLTNESQILHSIDFSQDYLENVNLQSAVPAYKSVRSLPFTNFASYTFEQELPSEALLRPTVIELTFVGKTVGEFSGVMDICLNDGTFCLALPLATAVVEE